MVTGRVAREQLRAHPAEQPFYMMVSFCGPHKPYDAPQRYLDMFPLEREDDFILPEGQIISDEDKESLYRQRRSAKAMIRLIDDQIGETLDVLRERGMLDDTLIVFTSDHGDMLGDHFMIQKGVPWKQSVGIPLAVRLPGAAPVGENTAPVEISDIAATVLDYAGLDAQRVLSRSWPAYNDIIPSRSLLPVLRGEQERVRDFCFSESDFTEERIDGVSITSTPYWRGADGCRSNAWQTIITENSKYIKYLGYKLGKCRMRNSMICNAIRRSAKTALQMKLIAIRSNRHAAGCRTWWIIIRRRRKRGQLPVRQIARRRRTKGVIMCRVFVFW